MKSGSFLSSDATSLLSLPKSGSPFLHSSPLSSPSFHFHCIRLFLSASTMSVPPPLSIPSSTVLLSPFISLPLALPLPSSSSLHFSHVYFFPFLLLLSIIKHGLTKLVHFSLSVKSQLLKYTQSITKQAYPHKICPLENVTNFE